MMFRTLAILFLASAASAWTPSSRSINRRDVMNTIAAGTFLAPTVVNAMDACPPNSKNCVRATWTPPSGTSQKDAIESLRGVLLAYPQTGQDGVDGGGWKIAEDDLASKGTARVEYKSSGKGNLAKFLNGGKPFTDDLLIEVKQDGVIELQSKSRVGSSDFGVNARRMDYLTNAIEALGWATA